MYAVLFALFIGIITLELMITKIKRFFATIWTSVKSSPARLDYALIRFKNQARILISTDGGQSWRAQCISLKKFALSANTLHDVLISSSFRNGSFILGVSRDSIQKRMSTLQCFFDKDIASIVLEYVFARFCFYPKLLKQKDLRRRPKATQ
jgi:hypothetical protein